MDVKKYILYPSYKIDYKDLEIRDDMSYIEKLVKILDLKETVMWIMTIHVVKVLWRNHKQEEPTWELES